MTGQSHTPGPWHLVSDRRSNGNGNRGYPDSDASPILLVCGPAGAPVISRRGLAKPSKPEGVANGRLIAAAPDHHAVALELHRLSLVIESAVRNADPAYRDEVLALINANRAAIAKATGGSV